MQHSGSLAPLWCVSASFPRLPVGTALMSADGRPVAAVGAVAPVDVEACRRGDRAALEVVFRAHAEPLARLLTRLVGPAADVEDLLQDTFAAAIAAFARFRGEASVKTWLHRIAIHVAHQHLRRPRHRREVALPDPDAVIHDPAPSSTPEARELAQRLYAHLDALSASRRIALVLYAIEERSVAEIAVLMGASKAATRSRIFWARRALMRRMRADRTLPDGGRR
jgi:RNA polymerase sigma-70 factor (ECF subfamily)